VCPSPVAHLHPHIARGQHLAALQLHDHEVVPRGGLLVLLVLLVLVLG
jgi:hypothetical protein